MRIRTSLIAVAGAALFAFVGAGTAQAGGHDDGIVVAHYSNSGVRFSDGDHNGGHNGRNGDRGGDHNRGRSGDHNRGHNGNEFVAWHVSATFVSIN
ncbi:hypothetical protein [Embleya scabrispora]|uniref:hypothetical protein n=1 Tax=Embleya scabrispora TaxID=159449 RepID=UPI000381450C|nr:hypothetical protein [Embleya scabrispora]MYS83071.1 hypothetical protein [Streptomyces sp. SID5474]